MGPLQTSSVSICWPSGSGTTAGSRTTMEISEDRNIWAGQDLTSSEDPISMPTFVFVFWFEFHRSCEVAVRSWHATRRVYQQIIRISAIFYKYFVVNRLHADSKVYIQLRCSFLYIVFCSKSFVNVFKIISSSLFKASILNWSFCCVIYVYSNSPNQVLEFSNSIINCSFKSGLSVWV